MNNSFSVPGRRFFAPAAISLLLGNAAIAQQFAWHSLGGPNGGIASYLAAGAGMVYTEMDDGTLYRSRNRGDSWDETRSRKDLARVFVTSSGALLAGSATGLFRSSDHGDSWTQTGFPQPWLLPLAEWNDSIIYAGVGDHHVSHSTDQGATWVDAGEGLPDYRALVVNSKGVVFILPYRVGGLYASHDAGLNWTYLPFAFTNQSYITSIVTAHADTLVISGLVLGIGEALFVSGDGGATWQQRSKYPGTITLLTTSPGGELLAVSDSAGLMRSTDLGWTWIPTSMHSPHIRAVVALTDELLIAAHDSTISLSTDRGATWAAHAGGITRLAPQELTTIDGNVFVSTDFDIYRDSNNSAAWIPTMASPWKTGSGARHPSLAGGDGQTLLAERSNGIFESSDFGTSWLPILAIDTAADIDLFTRTRNGTLFVSSSAGGLRGYCSRSSNNGATWSPCFDGGLIVRSVASGSRGVSFAGASRAQDAPQLESSGLFGSTDDGATWSLTRFVAPTGLSVRAIDATDAVYFTYADSLYVSRDGGSTWRVLNAGHVGPMVIDALGRLFITGQGEVLRSTDHGATWTDYSSGLTGGEIAAIASDSAGYLYCATQYGGVFKSTLPSTDVRPAAPTLPTGTVLEQNFPNPFTGSTSVCYTLDHDAFVELAVVDALGREVARVRDGRRPAGAHEINVPLQHITVGMYSVVLRADGEAVARSMIIAR